MQTGRRSASAGQRNAARKHAWLTSAVALSLLCAGAAQAQAVRAPTAADPRPLVITPSVGVQGSFTDNVRLTETNRDSDFVTRAFVGVDAILNGVRTKGVLQAQAAYDFYADADDLNGWSARGFGIGSYELVQNVLALELDGGLTNGNISTFGSSAIDRSGVDGRVQLATVGFGPRLTTRLGDFADLNAAARVSHVAYEEADGSTTALLPEDSTLFNADVAVDTADRYANVQLGLAASYEEDDQDFRSYSAVASSYFRVAPSVRLIARAGYDSIEDAANLDIDAPVWSLGVEYRPNDRALFSVEGGQRYDETTWAALANVEVTNRFYLSGSYSESVEPDQGRINRDFENFVAQQNAVATPLTPDEFTVNGNLYDSASLNKEAQLHAVYTWPTQTLELSAMWSDRYLYDIRSHDRMVQAGVTYSRQLRPDLTAELGADYIEVYDSPIFGESRSYGLSAQLAYNLNPTLQLTGGYAYSDDKRFEPGDEKIRENVVFVALLKTF